jgi:hypothetical protein
VKAITYGSINTSKANIQLDSSDCQLFDIFSHFVLTATLENMAKLP